jgi:hypothetical protein
MPISTSGTFYGDDELESLFKAVGFVVVQWGHAEQSIDLATGVLYQDLGGKALAKRLPKMLGHKLEFIEGCLANLPTLAFLRSEGYDLVADFRCLSATRHDLIHGAIASVSATDGGFEFIKLDFKNDDHVVREFRFEGDDFPKLTKDLLSLGARANIFACKLWELVKNEVHENDL